MSNHKMVLLDRAKNIINNAEKENMTIRLLGGLALYVLTPSCHSNVKLSRKYKDIDFVTKRNNISKLTRLLDKHDFKPERRFNALHGETRLLYFDSEDKSIQVDIFVDEFNQCHKLDILKDADEMTYTITPTQLFLTKLQIVDLNEKDVKDLVLMLLAWDFNNYKLGFDKEYLSYIYSIDWGLYTTSMDTLRKVERLINQYIDGDDLLRVKNMIDEIKILMIDTRKTWRFKLRDKIGRKISWYDIPEEVKR